MVLQVLAIVVLGLMCGSELNVAAFGHPTLDRQPLDVHIPVRAAFARLFGQRHALLDGHLHPPEPASAAALRTSGRARRPTCRNRLRHPGLRRPLLARRPRSHQQPHQALDAQPIFPATGRRRSAAGTSIIGSAPAASSSPSFCSSSALCDKPHLMSLIVQTSAHTTALSFKSSAIATFTSTDLTARSPPIMTDAIRHPP